VFDLFLCLPTTVFVIFLIIKLRSALRKLYETESLIMSTYYSFIWSVSIFNILRCLLNYFLKEPDIVYNILFLLSNFILVFLEISVVVFMSHGYMVSGREAIHRTIVITGAVCLVYITIQAGFLFGMNLKLYKQVDSPSCLYWFIVNFLFAIIYLVILILPKTSLRDKLPARRSFYHYVTFLFVLNFVKCIGEIMVYAHLDVGFCFIDVGFFAYYALYAPLLYICFLRDFFRDVTLPYGFVEMSKSGYLDSDT